MDYLIWKPCKQANCHVLNHLSNLAVIGRGGVHLRHVAHNFTYIQWFIFKSVIREKVEIKVQKRDKSTKEDRKSG